MRHLRTLIAACLISAVAVVAHATVVLEANVESLADACAVAVIGTVRSSDVVLEQSPQRIWTEVVLDVEETLLGEADGRLTVSVPGGSIAGLTQEIHGTPRMKRGKRVVVFLWKDGKRLQVLGMAQGCLHVRKSGGRDICRADISGLAIVRRDAKSTAPRQRDVPLADVRKTVRAVAARRAENEARRRRRIEQRLEEARRRAERNAERTRGRPGGTR